MSSKSIKTRRENVEMGMENRHCKISHRKPDIKGKQELIQWRTDVRYCTSPKASHIHTDSGNTVNEARALRVTELMRDYQSIHQTISNIQANPRPDDYHEIGYATLRQCHTEARALLNAGFSAELLQPSTNGDNAAKRQLQCVILDACARRLKAQKIYLGAAAAVKWINSRNAVLQGQKPQSGHVSKLQQVDNALRNDITNITDQRIFNAFRVKDQQAGYWLSDDPSLSALQSFTRSGH